MKNSLSSSAYFAFWKTYEGLQIVLAVSTFLNMFDAPMAFDDHFFPRECHSTYLAEKFESKEAVTLTVYHIHVHLKKFREILKHEL